MRYLVEPQMPFRVVWLYEPRPGDKPGQIKITRSGFDDDGISTVMDAQIVDTVVVAKRIVLHDFL